jgi:hypothetical protein
VNTGWTTEGTTLQALPARALHLYEAEHELLALMDADPEEEFGPEQEQELAAAIAESLQYVAEKRERFGLFLMWLDQQHANAKREIDRLRLRQTRLENLKARLKRYGVLAIRSLGTDQKGKFRKLVGTTVTLFIKALPASVDITDEAAVPSEYKKVCVQMPAQLYERLCTMAPVIAELPLKDVSIDKEAVRKALEQNREVPGADLRLPGHDHTLIVK